MLDIAHSQKAAGEGARWGPEPAKQPKTPENSRETAAKTAGKELKHPENSCSSELFRLVLRLFLWLTSRCFTQDPLSTFSGCCPAVLDPEGPKIKKILEISSEIEDFERE